MTASTPVDTLSVIISALQGSSNRNKSTTANIYGALTHQALCQLPLVDSFNR